MNRIDSKDEFVTEKERKRPSEQARGKVEYFAPLVNGHFSLIWMF